MLKRVQVTRADYPTIYHIENLQKDEGVEEESHVCLLVFSVVSQLARVEYGVCCLHCTAIVEPVHLLPKEDQNTHHDDVPQSKCVDLPPNYLAQKFVGCLDRLSIQCFLLWRNSSKS